MDIAFVLDVFRHKAEFADPCCTCFECGDASRTYFYVLEHGFTQNYPLAFWMVPPNACCPGVDVIYQTYFDRGAFDQQNLCWKIGFLNGQPALHANYGEWDAVCL